MAFCANGIIKAYNKGMNILLTFFLVVVGFNIAMFIPAYLYKTDKLTDISYALSFVALILFGYARSSGEWPHMLLVLLVVWWAARLGGFLFMRVQKKGKDARFDEMRNKPLVFLRFWLLQGATVYVVLLSSLLFMNTTHVSFGILSVLGLLVFFAGLVLESVADWQKWQFSLKKSNKGSWIDEGVWARSRHPNYLGEMLVWTGVYLYVAPSLTLGYALYALLSPAYIILLLLFVSGIPILEKAADARWGKDKSYQAYKRRVPVLIPKTKKS